MGSCSLLVVGWLVGVAVVVELCVIVHGSNEHECALPWHLDLFCSRLASGKSPKSASAWYYLPKTASVLGWLVFRMGVATIRILI